MKEFSRWIDDHIFTTTELENALACPFRLYAESFLGLKPVPEWEIEMTPAEVGDCLHRILAEYRPGAQESEDKLLKTADRILDDFQKSRPGLSLPLFERKRDLIERTLAQFLEAERGRDSGLQPAFQEWSFGLGNVPSLEIAGRRIRGRIDRIDVCHKKKQFLVIDYKTGSSTPTGAMIERGESVQLPIYLLAAHQFLLPHYEPIGALYYRLSDMSLKGGILHTERLPDRFEIGSLSSSLIPPARWQALFEKTGQTVLGLIDAMKSGKATPDPENCSPNCPFKEICLLRLAPQN